MKFRTFFTTVIVLVLLLTPCAHSAQLNFTPAFTVSEEYNDNIYLTPSNEESDFITRVSLGGTLELLGRSAGAELTYFPGYEFYKDDHDNNGAIHDGLGRIWYNISANTNVEVRNAFIYTRDNLQDTNYAGATSDDPLLAPDIETDRLRQGRDEYYINAASARFDHRFGAEDTVYTSFGYRILRGVDYIDRPDDDDDYDIWEPSIGGTYWFTHLWGAETDLVYSNREYETEADRDEWYGRFRLNRRITRHFDIYAQYEHTVVDYDDERPGNIDYDVYQPTVGFRYQLDANTRIEIGGGMYYEDLDNGTSEKGFAFTSLSDKVWPFRQGLVGITLLSGTDVDDEGTEDLGFHVYHVGTLRGEYAFTPRFSATATAGYRWDDYPDREPEERTDKTISGSVGLEYQALRWMFLNLDYTYRDLDSDEDNDEYTENRVMFSITLTPDQPFRLMR